CASFCAEWNAHPISGEGHDQSPHDMRLLGQLEHGIYLQNEVTLHPDVTSYYHGLQQHMDQSNSGDTISDDDEWEDIADNSEMTTGHSDLPSIIADDQASQFANDGAAVPMEISPFSTSNWEEVFKLALQQVQEIGHVPYGFGIQEEE
ncbi:hypothetical protein SCLCIDRAFT_145279, partial [Scleroderma citrinum Foug A]